MRMSPLIELLDYLQVLRSLTERLETYTAHFSYYVEVPGARPDDFPPAVGMRI
jgi:hypothetical protein